MCVLVIGLGMSETILERARGSHELIEKYELEVVHILDEKCSGQKAKTYQQHKVDYLLTSIMETEVLLLSLYQDQNHAMNDELNSMKGSNMFSSFYGTLKNINEYHHKYPNIPNTENNSIQIPEFESLVQFSGEEIFGKYLDLHSLYVQYCNLPNMTTSNTSSTGTGIQSLDYLQYLDKFNSFFYIPEGQKLNKSYGEYVMALWNYLQDFFHRIQPLVDMNEYLEQWKTEFIEKWNQGQIMVWKAPRKIVSNDPSSATPTPLRLGMFNSPEELEALGLDRLKEGLEALGLKCGGTLSERAKRLWSVRGKKQEEIPANLKAKKGPLLQNGDHDKENLNGAATFVPLGTGDDGRRQIALIEYNIQALCSLLSEIVTATRRHAEKQQTRTFEEKQLLIEEEEYGNLPDVEVIEEEDDDGPLYNPLNLPLGWDGKPIPYWLYKLHGLGTEFKCEICGNQSYWGRRAFDRHFQEWRHAHGMRCLGVPNTKHFHDITLIEDALSLYAKIKDSLKKEQFFTDMDEEFEDTEGNVLNRRTYEDLARQGLL